MGEARSVSRSRMDELWSQGWRHFGERFFRYSAMWHGDQWKRVINLRVPLDSWSPSRGQRRILRRNEDLKVKVEPANPGEKESALFHRHKVRFVDNVPQELSEFLGDKPNGVPTSCLQISVRMAGKLVAASFLDLGEKACSSIYAVFEPELSERRLGRFTLVQEMLLAKEMGLDYYYLGYATLEPSPYDYKKEVSPLWVWDWSEWRPITRDEYSKLDRPLPRRLAE